MQSIHQARSGSLLSGLSRLKWGSAALIMALSGGFTTGVQAQPGQYAGVLEEVVVTARRRDESMQEVPIAITALSDNFLQENNITSAADLRTHVPSLGISSVGSSANIPQVSLRGLRPDEVLLSLDPAVPLYFADVVMTPTHGTNLAMYDLAQVQVLKGPQGTLFGRNSTGGAIVLQPKAPGDYFGGYMNVKAGNYGMVGVEGAVDLPVSDKVQFRIAVHSLQRDGYQKNVADNALHDEDFWDQDSMGGRISMNVQLTDYLENALVVSYDENDARSRVPVPLAFNPDSQLGTVILNPFHNSGGAIDDALARQAGRDWQQIETDLDAREKVENTVVSNTTIWDLDSGVTVKNIIGYRKLDHSYVNDTDGTALPLFGSPTVAGSEVTFDPEARTIDSEQFSNELQVLGTSLDDRLDWLLGAYWYDLEGEERAPTMVAGPNPAFGFSGIYQNSPAGTVHNESTALFAEATYALTDRWNITLGARQSWDERSVTVKNRFMGECAVSDPDGNTLPDSNCARTESEKFSAPSWRAVADYTIAEGQMAYGSVSTGYRSGGFNLRGDNNLTLVPFDEETVMTYELGHKADWMLGSGASLRSNLAVYFSDYQDIQRTQDIASGGAPETRTVNAAEAEIKGLELDLLYRPTQDLDLKLGWSYVDAEYSEWIRPVQDSLGTITEEDVSGSPFVWIPEQSANASIKYYVPVSAELGEISLTASAYWQDEMFADDNLSVNAASFAPDVREAFLAAEVVDSYSVINLRADWRHMFGSGLDLAVFVNNLEDEEYTTGGLTVESTQGSASRVYGPPRTYGASLNYTF